MKNLEKKVTLLPTAEHQVRSLLEMTGSKSVVEGLCYEALVNGKSKYFVVFISKNITGEIEEINKNVLIGRATGTMRYFATVDAARKMILELCPNQEIVKILKSDKELDGFLETFSKRKHTN